MYSQQILLAVLAALSVSAVPLNINLGAYSPALVVGDGEISFGGSPERASEVLQTLSSGAAGQPGARPPAQAAPLPIAPQAAAQGIRPAEAGTPASTLTPGVASPIVAATIDQPAIAAVDANTAPAPALGGGGQIPAEFISHAIAGNHFPNMAKTKTKRSIITDAEKTRRSQALNERVKRDIEGFRAALQFARDAQATTPKIELGFGITQNAGVGVPVNSAANGALPPGGVAAPREKRDVQRREEGEEKLGMTLIAISEI